MMAFLIKSKQVSQSVYLICTETFISNSLQFFLGDLNFRINDLTNEEVLLSIQNLNYSQLIKHDQVRI